MIIRFLILLTERNEVNSEEKGKPFQEAFSDKVCIDEARLFMGEWAAAFGRQEAIHSGEFMGIPATGKRVQIKYMDFWKVENGLKPCSDTFPT